MDLEGETLPCVSSQVVIPKVEKELSLSSWFFSSVLSEGVTDAYNNKKLFGISLEWT